MMSRAHDHPPLVHKVHAHYPDGLAQLHPIVGHVFGAKHWLVTTTTVIQVPHFEVVVLATGGK